MRPAVALAAAVPLGIAAMTVAALIPEERPAPTPSYATAMDRNHDGAPDDTYVGVWCHEEFDTAEGLRNCWANGGW